MSETLRDRIKAVFFDIDDTIYSKDTDQLSPGIEKVFTRLQQRGIVPGIATGRARYIFPPVLEAVLARTGVERFVTINGQLNLHRQELVSDYPIAADDVARIVRYFQGEGVPLAFAGRTRMAVDRDDPRFNAALDPITREHPVDPHAPERHAVYQVIAGYDESREAAVQASGVLDGGRFKTVRWHPDAVDVLNVEGSKVRGIRDMIAPLGLTLDNVMVFGDSLNDIEMLSEAGFGVAMGNGHPQAIARADFRARPQAEGGVFHALVELGLIDGD